MVQAFGHLLKGPADKDVLVDNGEPCLQVPLSDLAAETMAQGELSGCFQGQVRLHARRPVYDHLPENVAPEMHGPVQPVR
jgi:hypothetical protein